LFPEGDRQHRDRSGRLVTFRRFVVVWTLLAIVAWLYAASWGDTDCRETDFVCFSQRDVDLIAAIVVGIPWLLGIFAAGIVAGLVKWHRKLRE